MKPSRAYFWESQRIVGNRDSIFRETHKISHALGFRAEGIIGKNLRQTHLLILDSFPERQEATGVHHRDTDPDSSHCGALILPRAHWCWTAPLWDPIYLEQFLGMALSTRGLKACPLQPCIGTRTATPQGPQPETVGPSSTPSGHAPPPEPPGLQPHAPAVSYQP